MSRDPIGCDGSNCYAYADDRPTLFRDPSGTVFVGDPPTGRKDLPKGKEKPPELSDPDKTDLKGCACAAVPIDPGQLKEPLLGTVICKDNGFIVHIPGGPAHDKMAKCHYDTCLIEHEKHHIKQAMSFCPDACKGKKCDFRGKPPEVFALAFEDIADCIRRAECQAWRVTLECVLHRFEQRPLPMAPEYMECACFALQTAWTPFSKVYHCRMSKDLQGRFDAMKTACEEAGQWKK